jgi:hypothetical protein
MTVDELWRLLNTTWGSELLPKSDDNATWTRWWEGCLENAAHANGWYCQNRLTGVGRPSGEYMNLDHTIIAGCDYRSFPLIVAEHENGNLASTASSLPAGNDPTARVEWALWKLLAIRANARLLIAYPRPSEGNAVRHLIREITRAAQLPDPALLVLLGYWPPTGPDRAPAAFYSAHAVGADGELGPQLSPPEEATRPAAAGKPRGSTRCHNCQAALSGQWTRLNVAIERTVQIAEDSVASLPSRREVFLCGDCADRASIRISLADHPAHDMAMELMRRSLRGK